MSCAAALHAWATGVPSTTCMHSSHLPPALPLFCSTLFGLALSNLGIVPAEAPHVYGVVNSYLLPLAVPLLLFSADLRWDVRAICGVGGT